MSASSPSPTAAQRRAEAEATKEARMQQQRQRPLPTWLATRSSRRTLAAAVPTAIFAIGILAALSASSLGWAVMMAVPILGLAGILTLRRATQALDVAPTALLDEREITQRDRGYRNAFHLAAALVFALWMLAVVDGAVAKSETGGLLVGDAWIYLTLASFFTVFTLPAAALTWRWRPPTDEHEE